MLLIISPIPDWIWEVQLLMVMGFIGPLDKKKRHRSSDEQQASIIATTSKPYLCQAKRSPEIKFKENSDLFRKWSPFSPKNMMVRQNENSNNHFQTTARLSFEHPSSINSFCPRNKKLKKIVILPGKKGKMNDAIFGNNLCANMLLL